ncbi:hypothetical protein Q7A53_05875 [Halobacillus rhizosphaerae]|uniref:hypothetical protein n=1 Tax=Halobacillus rhizosphaerae TaxID=3064889 RepID=UPI00398A64B0
MKTLKEMNNKELNELLTEWKELYFSTKCDNFRENAIDVENELIRREKETKKIVISVFFETGYKWSVSVEGEEESRDTNINKNEAMELARDIRRNEFGYKNSMIVEQKMNKKQKSENMKYLHENTETYGLK